MFSPFVFKVIEAMSGKSLPVLFEQITSVSAKTWKKGGPKYPNVEGKAKSAFLEWQTRSMVESGYTRQEIAEKITQISENPSGLWESLVASSSGYKDKFLCHRALAIAARIDIFSTQLSKLKKSDDIDGFRKALLNSDFSAIGSEWLCLQKEYKEALDSANQANTWLDVAPLTGCVFSVAILNLLSCWDIEFYSLYFRKSRMKPRPLFELVMPRMKPGFKQNTDGTFPFRGVFHLPLRRLIDLCYCMSEFHKNEKWPQKNQVSRNQIAPAGGDILLGNGCSGQPLAKIRKGIRGLTAEEFRTVFQDMCGHDKEGIYPFPPMPIYFAAQIWTALFVKKDSNKYEIGATGILYGFESQYRYWWDWYLAEFKAGGIEFGNTPWPSYLGTN